MFNAHHLSIRSWLGSLAGAVALPLLLLLTWLFVSEVRREEAEARDTALRTARATATQLQVLHNDAVALLGRMAARPSIRNFNGAACDSLFAVVDFDPQDENIFLFDREGHLLCAGKPLKLDPTLSTAAEGWIEGELRAGRFPPLTPIMRTLGKQWVTALSMAVTDERGVPRGAIALMQISEIVGAEALPRNSVVTVLDNAGTIIVRSSQAETWNGRNVRDSTLARIALREQEGQAEAAGLDGVPRQYGFTRLPELGWHVYVGIPTDQVMRPVRRLLLRGLAGGLLIVMLATGVAFMLARHIAKPINALARAAVSISGGTYATVATIEGPREIALLAETFNEMVANRSSGESRIHESERNLKALSERLLAIQEEERARIAREIHDDLGQSLTALKMDVIGLLNSSTDPAGAPVRERILRTLDATVTAVQRIASELRPPLLDDLGLAAAIESEARLFEERSAIECEVSIPPDDETRVDPVSASAIYRIIQEALTNVARHSEATRVELRIRRRGEELLIEVRDDGRGMNAEAIGNSSSLGLIGIRERAAILGGTVHFEGVAGRGSIVSVRLPAPLPRTSS